MLLDKNVSNTNLQNKLSLTSDDLRKKQMRSEERTSKLTGGYGT